MDLTGDVFILLSRVNTMLRDTYHNLALLCEEEDVSQEELEQKLSSIGYHYSPEQNRFM